MSLGVRIGAGLRATLTLALMGALTGALVACGGASAGGEYDRGAARESLSTDAGLVLGEFPLRSNGVVDGDTIRVGGLDGSLRLLALDTEETFKSERDRRDYEAGWESYLASRMARTSRPIKVPTPLGEEAKYFARDFFEGVQRVRIERDHPREIRGRFNRFLAYVFVERDGRWVNYNVECVRAGMSPYFTKYGYSRRFHDEFVAAQREARDAQRGIWDPSKQHYTDYDARLAWWDARADFVQAFERDAEGRADFIALTNWDALRRLDALEGEYVTVLATVGEIRQGERGPVRVMLSRRMFSDVPAVFFDPYVLEDSRAREFQGEYVRMRGRVQRWTNPYNGREQLQLRVDQASQVQVPAYTPPGNGDATSADEDAPDDEPTDASPTATPPDPTPSAASAAPPRAPQVTP
ncbi:MAG: thermonuclease family protein [Myxococcales bacterium]|nr:thermonuclease family protein [Myxococcales bacterium]